MWRIGKIGFVTNGNPEKVGDFFAVHSNLRTASLLLRRTTIVMKVTVFEEQKHICWNTMGLPSWARHCFFFCEVDGSTVWYNYEDQKGVMTGVIEQLAANATRDGFNRFNANMTTEVEKQVRVSSMLVFP